MDSLDIVKAIKYLQPNAEFTFEGNNYDSITWTILEGEAPTLAELEAAHQAVQLAETQALAQAQAKRQALLDKLGITEEEARLLLGGN